MKASEIIKMGDKLRTIRKKLGLTQIQAAEKIGINVVQYRRYENNNAIPGGRTLQKIAAALDVEARDLIGDTQLEQAASALEDQISKIYSNTNLSPDEKERLITQLQNEHLDYSMLLRILEDERLKNVIDFYLSLSAEGQEMALACIKSLFCNPAYQGKMVRPAPEIVQLLQSTKGTKAPDTN